MTRRLLIPFAALAVCAVAASPAAAKQVTLTKADSGKTITVHQGDTIAVSLAANETTGYSWDVGTTPAKKVAKITVDKYNAAAPGSPPGAGGSQSYVIKAVGQGTTSFATTYKQVGSGNTGATFTIKIRVQGRSAGGKTLKLTANASGKTYTVAKGDTIVVSIRTNEDPPWQWVVTAKPKASVARVTSTYRGPSGSSGLGLRRFTIKAVGAGTTNFQAKYENKDTGQLGSSTGSAPVSFAIKIRVTP